MKHLVVLLIFFSLLGCSSTRTHNPDGIAKNKLAYVFKKPHKAFSSDPSVFIHVVFNSSGQSVIEFKRLQNAVKEVYLQPGKYRFILQCNYGSGATNAEVSATVESGKSYKYSCDITSDKVFIGSGLFHKSVESRQRTSA